MDKQRSKELGTHSVEGDEGKGVRLQLHKRT